MARLNLSQAQSITDPFITHDWNIIFTSIPGAAGLDLRQLSMRAQTSSIPGITVEPTVVALKDVEVSFALRQTWPKTLSCTFLEVRDMTTRDAFLAWAKFAKNMRTGVGAYKSEYAIDVIMELYDATDSVIRIVKLLSAWPSEVGELGLESPGNPGYLPVTFTYDATDENGE